MDHFVEHICKETGCAMSRTKIELEGVEDCVSASRGDEHIYDHVSERQVIELYEEPPVQVLHPPIFLPPLSPKPTHRRLNDLSIRCIKRWMSLCAALD